MRKKLIVLFTTLVVLCISLVAIGGIFANSTETLPSSDDVELKPATLTFDHFEVGAKLPTENTANVQTDYESYLGGFYTVYNSNSRATAYVRQDTDGSKYLEHRTTDASSTKAVVSYTGATIPNGATVRIKIVFRPSKGFVHNNSKWFFIRLGATANDVRICDAFNNVTFDGETWLTYDEEFTLKALGDYVYMYHYGDVGHGIDIKSLEISFVSDPTAPVFETNFYNRKVESTEDLHVNVDLTNVSFIEGLLLDKEDGNEPIFVTRSAYRKADDGKALIINADYLNKLGHGEHKFILQVNEVLYNFIVNVSYNTFIYKDANDLTIGMSGDVLMQAVDHTDNNYQFIGWYNEEVGLYPAKADLSSKVLPENTVFTPAYVKIITKDGASVKLTKNKPTGLEFYIETDLDAKYDSFVERHTLIAPTDYLDDVGEFTVEAFNAIDKDVLMTTYKNNIMFDAEGEYDYYAGSIVNIYQYNYARKFSARGYLTVNYTEGDPVNVYGSFNEEENSRSIYEVAVKAYADRKDTIDADEKVYTNDTGNGYSRFDNEDLSIIKSYIDGVVNFNIVGNTVNIVNPCEGIYDAPYEVSISDKTITISPKEGSDWTFYQGVTGKTEYYRVSIIINGIRQIPTNTEQFIVSDSTSNTKDVIGTITVKVILGPGDVEDIFPED
ncbi:MAG: hypothetical protein E7342_05215 [Clostridiales bacterium]|nr:hypothetical protein [Clostridiales bacterium]